MSWHISPAAAKDYVGQRRSGSAVASIEAHLPTCGECRRLVADVTAATHEPLLGLVWQRVTTALDDATRPWSERALTRVGLSTETGSPARRHQPGPAVVPFRHAAHGRHRVRRRSQRPRRGSSAPSSPSPRSGRSWRPRWPSATASTPRTTLITTAPTSVWRIVLLRTAASLIPAVAITGLASLIVHERGWVAMAWLLPGIAMAVVSLALSTWVPIEHAALGVGHRVDRRPGRRLVACGGSDRRRPPDPVSSSPSA